MKKTKRLLIIPARSGSKRIKNKNIKNFFDKPIIHYPLKVALKSNIFNKIHVSTDSKRIQKTVQIIGNFVDFLRPKNLSKDETSLKTVINYVLNNYEKRGLRFDEVWIILPCSPLLRITDIKGCERLIKKYKKPIIAVSPYPAPISWSFQIKKNLIFNANEKKIRDKKLSKISSFYDSGQIYCFPIEYLKKRKFNFNEKIYTYKLPLERSVDIDTKADWNFAKILFRGISKS